MPAARYVQARQYASSFRSSSLESRSVVTPGVDSVAVGRASVISCVIYSPPLSRSPCDHSFPANHREPRDQAFGLVVTADAEEIVQTAIPRVTTDQRLKPEPAFDGPDEVTVEVSPGRLSPPAFGLA